MAFDIAFRYNIFMKKAKRRDSITRARRELTKRSYGRESFHNKLRECLIEAGVSPPVTQAEIWIDGYLTGKCFLGFLHPGDGKVYTFDYRAITNAISPCLLYVTGDILEIQKSDLPEETRGIPLLHGHAAIDELILTLENTSGYYIKDITDINTVRIVNIVREPLTIWIAGKEIQGYMKNGVKHIGLNDIQNIAHLIGTYNDNGKVTHSYLMADIYDRKLRLEGLTLKSVPLPYYNALDLERIIDKGCVEGDGFMYVVSSEWTNSKTGTRYAAIAQKADMKVWGELDTPNKPPDFGQVKSEYPPANSAEVRARIWLNGQSIDGKAKNKQIEIDGGKKSKEAQKYFYGFPDVISAIERRGDNSVASFWYDSDSNEETVIINAKMKDSPMRLIRRGCKVTITANIIYKGKVAARKFEDSTDDNYADTITRGIKECFEGRYNKERDYIDVEVNITHNPKAPHVLFTIGEKGQASSPYETSWEAGKAKKNTACCFAASISSYNNYANLAQQAAHLFGHMLGLTDTKDTGTLMSDTSAKVSLREIEAAIAAVRTNRRAVL